MSLIQKSKPMVFPRAGRYLLLFFMAALLGLGIWGYLLYNAAYRPNVQKDYVLYVTDKTSFDMVYDSLEVNGVMRSMKAFRKVVVWKKCRDQIRAGRYHFTAGMSTNQAVNMLRAGMQEPVTLVFNNIRTAGQLARVVSRTLEADSASVADLFNGETAARYGFTAETFPAMFIPNTYELYWTTTAEAFADRMKREYEIFWNGERQNKALGIGLTPAEVATLASIVQEETNKNSEKARIAGVYLNRLRKGMLLQADPTVKFAAGDPSLRRILNRHLEIDSPYNTYRYAGLPPGPINFPDIRSIDAVLNFEQHNLLYFCAREDFSGYHNFARTHAEHARHAARYHAALDSLAAVRRAGGDAATADSLDFAEEPEPEPEPE